jgi:hypothetical protein
MGFRPFRGQILLADLAAQGLDGRPVRQLFFRGERQTQARYPNVDPSRPRSGGWALVDGLPVSKYREQPDDSKQTLRLGAADVRTWESVEGAEIFIFPRWNWWNDIIPVAGFDRDARTLTLARDASFAVRPQDRFFVQNLLSELDKPGEWYLDRKQSLLYFWPPHPLKADIVTVPVLDSVIQIKGAHHVHVRGFTIQENEGSALVLENASDCLVAGNTIRNSGGRPIRDVYAVVVSGGSNNGVVGNDIAYVGSGGILLRGGIRKVLTSSGHFAENNHIHHTGVYYKQGVGITLDGVGNRASRNLLHDLPRMAIDLGGNNHVVELNHIHHVNLETEDTGAIYAGGRDWLSPRGTVIRHNLIEDSMGFGFEGGRWRSPHFAFGIYLDDNAAGVDVIGNIVARSSWANVYLHNGRDNLIESNLLIDGGQQQIRMMSFQGGNRYLPEMSRTYREFAQLPAWQSLRGFVGVAPEDAVAMANNAFLRNVVVYEGSDTHYVWQRGLPFEATRFESNVVFRRDGPVLIEEGRSHRRWDWSYWRSQGMDRTSILADPQVWADQKGIPMLGPASPAYRMGFRRIPAEEIGLYRSDLRASWPIVEPPTVRERLD